MLRFELKHLGDFNYRTDALNHVFGDTNSGRLTGKAGSTAFGLSESGHMGIYDSKS